MKHKHRWQVEAAQCDVVDQATLLEYRTHAERWIKALDDDDVNSVTSQINDMMWTDAAWRSLNEARRLGMDDVDAGTPGLVAALLDRGYIAGQVIAIGRLLDPSASQPKRQVNSIRRLVDDITRHKRLFTREIYVCHDGLPYDFAAIRTQELGALTGAVVQWLPTAGSLAWHQSMLRQEEFDRLSETLPGARRRDDTISDAIFQGMADAFDDQVFKDILEMRHKSIAHAADDFSRSTASNLRSGFSLDEFARAHYLLLGLYQAISANLLYQSWLGAAVPVPQHDQFEGFDKPLVHAGKLADLHDFWNRHGEERDGWLSKAYREFIPAREGQAVRQT